MKSANCRLKTEDWERRDWGEREGRFTRSAERGEEEGGGEPQRTPRSQREGGTNSVPVPGTGDEIGCGEGGLWGLEGRAIGDDSHSLDSGVLPREIPVLAPARGCGYALTVGRSLA